MSHVLRVALAMACLLAAETAASAQTSTPSWASSLTIGQRVRVRSTTEPGVVAGGLAAIEAESLTVVPDGSFSIQIPVHSITAVDTSLGRKRNWLKGLGIGFAIGLAVGLAVKVDATNCGPETTNFCSRGEALAGGTVFFGGIGAAVGALIKSERWTPIRDPGNGIRD